MFGHASPVLFSVEFAFAKLIGRAGYGGGDFSVAFSCQIVT